MKKIKILRIIARLNIGGPAIHCILLTEGLNKGKFNSVLVSGKVDISEGDMLYLANEKNVKPIIIPELGRSVNFIKDVVAFCRLFLIIFREKPDIIHTHTAKAGSLGRFAGLLYKLLSGRRCILIHTFHGHVFGGYFGKRKTKVFIWIERLLAKFTDRIVVVSNAIKNELIELGIGNFNKISIIPLGLELDGLLTIPIKNNFKNNSELKIGIIGRLTSIKNHLMFLRVIKKLMDLKSLTQMRFIIAGDGELRESLENYAHSLRLNNFVIFAGWQKDLINLYSQLDIVALTSLNEGTPVSLIEAMAAGRPVVATNVGGVKDLVNEDRGFLVESEDIDGFASALKSLLEDENLRRRLGQFGREFVRNKFTKGRLINDIEVLYEELLKERKI